MSGLLECGHDFSPSNYRRQGAVHQCHACHRERLEAKKAKTRARDDDICADFLAGASIKELAARYGLGEFRIYAIVRPVRPNGNKLTADPLYPQRALERAAQLSFIRVEQIQSDERFKHLVRTRWAVMAALHERGMSYKAIGRRLRRDHSTVMYGVRQAEYHAQRSPAFRALIEQVAAA